MTSIGSPPANREAARRSGLMRNARANRIPPGTPAKKIFASSDM